MAGNVKGWRTEKRDGIVCSARFHRRCPGRRLSTKVERLGDVALSERRRYGLGMEIPLEGQRLESVSFTTAKILGKPSVSQNRKMVVYV